MFELEIKKPCSFTNQVHSFAKTEWLNLETMKDPVFRLFAQFVESTTAYINFGRVWEWINLRFRVKYLPDCYIAD